MDLLDLPLVHLLDSLEHLLHGPIHRFLVLEEFLSGKQDIGEGSAERTAALVFLEELGIAFLVDHVKTCSKVRVLPLDLQSAEHDIRHEDGGEIESRVGDRILMADDAGLLYLRLFLAISS